MYFGTFKTRHIYISPFCLFHWLLTITKRCVPQYNTPIFPDSKFSIDTCSDPGPGSNMASESISICINVVSLQCREKIYEHVLHIISLCISTLALLYERRKQESSPCTYITWLHVAAMMRWRVEPGLGVLSSQSILLSSLHGKHQQPICPWSRQHWDQHLISFTAQILLSALHQSMNTATSYFCFATSLSRFIMANMYIMMIVIYAMATENFILLCLFAPFVQWQAGRSMICECVPFSRHLSVAGFCSPQTYLSHPSAPRLSKLILFA